MNLSRPARLTLHSDTRVDFRVLKQSQRILSRRRENQCLCSLDLLGPDSAQLILSKPHDKIRQIWPFHGSLNSLGLSSSPNVETTTLSLHCVEILGDQDTFNGNQILYYALQGPQFVWSTANLFHTLKGRASGGRLQEQEPEPEPEPEPQPIDPRYGK